MGNKHTADGRWIVGNGNSGDDYKGFLHWRECYICLTESGATEESVDYLNALKDYALAHYALGEPIMPPSMTVWVVANGKATAVQADDVKVEDGDYTICGITYSDGAWDYSNAGQGQGGGESGYTVEETKQTVIAEQTVQTVSQGDWYSGSPSGDLSGVSDGTKCFVTYNGTEYEVDATEDAEHGVLVLGELGGQSPVFTNYPFVIAASAGQSFLMAQTANPTIKVEVLSKTVTPSDDFKAAVEASGIGGILRVSFGWDEQADTDTADKTFAEILAAINAGKTVVGIDDYEGEVTNLELVSYSDSNLVFCGINMRKAMLYSGATLMFVQYEISSEDQVTSDSQEYTLTPSNGG